MATKPPDLTPIREQVYKDPRPKEFFDGFHARTRARPPDWVYEIVRMATSLYAWTFFRARGIDAQKVPVTGAVICTSPYGRETLVDWTTFRRTVTISRRSNQPAPLAGRARYAADEGRSRVTSSD